MGGTEEVFLYKKLAADIEDKISRGTYQPGERLPSIRSLHQRLKLSLTTVYQAYIELENPWPGGGQAQIRILCPARQPE